MAEELSPGEKLAKMFVEASRFELEHNRSMAAILSATGSGFTIGAFFGLDREEQVKFLSYVAGYLRGYRHGWMGQPSDQIGE